VPDVELELEKDMFRYVRRNGWRYGMAIVELYIGAR
jgi:hypothetical protein